MQRVATEIPGPKNETYRHHKERGTATRRHFCFPVREELYRVEKWKRIVPLYCGEFNYTDIHKSHVQMCAHA